MSNSDGEAKLSISEKRDLIIEAALQLIPSVGSSLATLYFGAKHEIRFKRLETFYREVARELQALEGKIVPVQEHDKEVLVAIIEELNENVERERIDKKRFFLKCYLKNTLVHPMKSHYYDTRFFFLNTLRTMTLLECELLIDLYETSSIPSVGNLKKSEVDEYAIVGAVSRLKSYGFLESHGFLKRSPPIPEPDDQTWDSTRDPLDECVVLSFFGREFCKFCLNSP